MPIMRADPGGPCLDGWTLLAALAAQTKRLRLGLMVEEFQHKNRVLDGLCAEIERDPATLVRSVQIIIDPREDPATTRQIVQGFIAEGATHLVLAPRRLDEGIAHWISEEIIQPVREAAGDNTPG